MKGLVSLLIIYEHVWNTDNRLLVGVVLAAPKYMYRLRCTITGTLYTRCYISDRFLTPPIRCLGLGRLVPAGVGLVPADVAYVSSAASSIMRW